jgi:hypothetical protein
MKSIEKQLVFVEAWFRGFWPADCWPPFEKIVENGELVTGSPTNSDGLRNLQVLKKAIDRLPEDEPVDLMYARELFFKLREDGDLVRKQGTVIVQREEPKPVDPATTLPHAKEARLRNLRTVEDFKDLTSEQVRVFTQPAAIDNGMHAKFNERYRYVVDNNLRRPKVAKVEEAPVQQPKQPTRIHMLTAEEARIANMDAEYNQQHIDEANNIIANHRGRNHASTSSERQILLDTRNSAIKSGKTAKQVLDAVKTKWNDFAGDNGGIR